MRCAARISVRSAKVCGMVTEGMKDSRCGNFLPRVGNFLQHGWIAWEPLRRSWTAGVLLAHQQHGVGTHNNISHKKNFRFLGPVFIYLFWPRPMLSEFWQHVASGSCRSRALSAEIRLWRIIPTFWDDTGITGDSSGEGSQ